MNEDNIFRLHIQNPADPDLCWVHYGDYDTREAATTRASNLVTNTNRNYRITIYKATEIIQG